MLLPTLLLLGSALAQSHTFTHDGIEVTLPGLVVPTTRDALGQIDEIEVVLPARPLLEVLQKRAPPPGPLFGDSGLPSVNDPRQNNSVNSCGLSAAMIAVAHTLPGVLQANLHIDSSSSFASADSIQVDVTDFLADPPVLQRKTVSKSSLNSTNMLASDVWWPGAFEKAIELIPQNTTWRSAGQGMKMITGLQDDMRFLEPSMQESAVGKEELFADMLKAEGTPILLQTLNETRRGDVLVVNHVYAVLSAYMNGTRWAHLKDPLGPEIRLPLDTFWPQLYLYNYLAGYPTQESIDAGTDQGRAQGSPTTGSPRATVYVTPTPASAAPARSGSAAAVLAYEGDARVAPADAMGTATGAGRRPAATIPADTGVRADEEECDNDEDGQVNDTGGAPTTATGSRSPQAAPNRTGTRPGANGDAKEDCGGEDDDDEGTNVTRSAGATPPVPPAPSTVAPRPTAVNAAPTGGSPGAGSGAGAGAECEDDGEDEDTSMSVGPQQTAPRPLPVNSAPTGASPSPGAGADSDDSDADCEGADDDGEPDVPIHSSAPSSTTRSPATSSRAAAAGPGNAEATGTSPGAGSNDGCDEDDKDEDVPTRSSTPGSTTRALATSTSTRVAGPGAAETTGTSPGADPKAGCDDDEDDEDEDEDEDGTPAMTRTGAPPASSVASRPQPGYAQATGVSAGADADADDGCDDGVGEEELGVGRPAAPTRSVGANSASTPTAAASPGNQGANEEQDEGCDEGNATTRGGAAVAPATTNPTASPSSTRAVNANQAGATASPRPAGPGSGSAEPDEEQSEAEAEVAETTVVRKHTVTVLATTTDAPSSRVSYVPTNPAFSLPASSAAAAPVPLPIPVITNEEPMSDSSPGAGSGTGAEAASDLGASLGLDASTLQALGEWLREHLPQLLQKLRDQKPQSDRW